MSQEINIETDDWKLGCFMDWQPKNHSEDCPTCKGKGEIGGGLGWMDDDKTCPDCHGMRFVTKGPRTPKPALPKAVVEHMRRAWWDFFNKEQNDKDK